MIHICEKHELTMSILHSIQLKTPQNLSLVTIYEINNEFNLKFFSLFLSLNSVLFLNIFVITSDPLSASSLRTLHSSHQMIFFFLVLGLLWPRPGPLHLLVHHSGITSLLLSVPLFSLLLVIYYSMQAAMLKIIQGILTWLSLVGKICQMWLGCPDSTRSEW